MVAPNSTIILLKTPMELSDSNTLSFSSESAKYNYFNSLPKLTLDNATYQRKDGVVRYPTNSNITFEDLLKYNYCMYQNTSYNSKWFYAYIIEVRYLSDGMSEIVLKTDAFMTWQNSITFKQSFVERAHVADDTIGKHTIPENVETGEFIVVSQEHAQIGGAHLVIASAWNPFTEKPAGSLLNGIYHGCDYFLIKNNESNDISYFMGMMATQSKSDAILGLFMAPDELTDYDNISWDYMFHPEGSLTSQYPYKRLTTTQVGAGAKELLIKSVTKNYSTIDGYTPKNNKLFTSQFNYLLVSNNNGGACTYNYEDFSTNTCDFRILGAITPGCSIRCYPKNYKGITNNMEEGLNGGKYPVCSYTTDMYINWLTQNSVNIKVGNFDFDVRPDTMGMVSGISSIIGGASLMATGEGAIVGASKLFSGAGQIGSAIAEKQKHAKMPPQFGGNLNCGDVMFASDWVDLTFRKQCIKQEYAKCIDNYLSMFGYAINRVETVNFHKRQYWDYMKTIGCNIVGDIPQEDMAEIRNLFDNGITVWHNTDHFLDYSMTNSIIS